MTLQGFQHCHLCDFVGINLHMHIIKQHADHPSFKISCSLCGGTRSWYSSYQKNVRRRHRNLCELAITDEEAEQIEDATNFNALIANKTNKKQVIKKS